MPSRRLDESDIERVSLLSSGQLPHADRVGL